MNSSENTDMNDVTNVVLTTSSPGRNVENLELLRASPYSEDAVNIFLFSPYFSIKIEHNNYLIISTSNFVIVSLNLLHINIITCGML